MSRDELFVVLLKLFGFSVVIRALVMFVQLAGTYSGFLFTDIGNSGNMISIQAFSMLAASAVQIILGFLVIAKSSSISRWLLAMGQDNSTTDP